MIDSCGGFCSVPGPLQTVQRAKFWGLQASDAIHLGVDNLDVVGQVGRLLDGVRSSWPAELLNDGDLAMLINRILEQRGSFFLCSVSRPRLWKRLRVCGQRSCASVDAKRRRLHQLAEVLPPAQDRVGVG